MEILSTDLEPSWSMMTESLNIDSELMTPTRFHHKIKIDGMHSLELSPILKMGWEPNFTQLSFHLHVLLNSVNVTWDSMYKKVTRILIKFGLKTMVRKILMIVTEQLEELWFLLDISIPTLKSLTAMVIGSEITEDQEILVMIREGANNALDIKLLTTENQFWMLLTLCMMIYLIMEYCWQITVKILANKISIHQLLLLSPKDVWDVQTIWNVTIEEDSKMEIETQITVFATDKTAMVMAFWYKEVKMMITKIKESVNLAQITWFSILLKLDVYHAWITKELSQTEMVRKCAMNQIAELDIIPIKMEINLCVMLIWQQAEAIAETDAEIQIAEEKIQVLLLKEMELVVDVTITTRNQTQVIHKTEDAEISHVEDMKDVKQ